MSFLFLQIQEDHELVPGERHRSPRVARKFARPESHRESVAPGQDVAAEKKHLICSPFDGSHTGDVDPKDGRCVLSVVGEIHASTSATGHSA